MRGPEERTSIRVLTVPTFRTRTARRIDQGVRAIHLRRYAPAGNLPEPIGRGRGAPATNSVGTELAANFGDPTRRKKHATFAVFCNTSRHPERHRPRP